MDSNRQVTDPARAPRPNWSCRAAALGILAAAGLIGGCASASPGQQGQQAARRPAGTPAAASSPAGGPERGTRATHAAAGCAGGGAASGSAPALQAVQFTDPGHGWAAGAGRILATSDGGRTWTRKYSGPAALDQLDFTDAAHGWAVGPGTLLRTADGGATWTGLGEPRVGGRCLAIASVHFLSPVLGYAIAEAGATAGGTTAGGATGAAPAGGQLLRTSDGGASWTPVPGAPAGAQTACFGTPQDGYAGAAGRIWRTTDAGATWSLAFTEPPASGAPGARPSGDTPGDTPQVQCAGPHAAWVLFLDRGAAMMHAPYLAYATQDGRGWRGVFEETMLESAARPGLHLPAGPGSEPGPFSVISPGAAAFVGYTPPANGWGAAPLEMASQGGAALQAAGDVAAINQPLAAAFLTPARGWVVGENLKTRTYEIEATADAGRTWTTQYATG